MLNSKWYRTVLYETYKYIRAYKHMIQIDSDREWQVPFGVGIAGISSKSNDDLDYDRECSVPPLPCDIAEIRSNSDGH